MHLFLHFLHLFQVVWEAAWSSGWVQVPQYIYLVLFLGSPVFLVMLAELLPQILVGLWTSVFKLSRMHSCDELVISAYFVFLAVIRIRVSNDVVFIFIKLKFLCKLEHIILPPTPRSFQCFFHCFGLHRGFEITANFVYLHGFRVFCVELKKASLCSQQSALQGVYWYIHDWPLSVSVSITRIVVVAKMFKMPSVSAKSNAAISTQIHSFLGSRQDRCM